MKAGQMRGDRAIARIHARFAKVLRNAPMMVWMAASDGAVTYVNRKWLTFAGRRSRDELGDGWLESVHADDRPRVLGEYAAAILHQAPFAIEYKLRRADHIYRDICHYGLPLHEDDGKFAGFVGTAVDITARRGGTAELERTVEHLRLVATHADEMIYRFEAQRDAQIALLNGLIAHMNDGVLAEIDDGAVVVANSAFYRLFDIPETPAPSAASLRQAILATLATSDTNRTAAIKRDSPAQTPEPPASDGESRPQQRSEYALKDGRTLEQEYFSMRLDDGRVVHVWQLRDVTVRKEKEEQARTSRHRLRDLSAHLEAAREEERRQLARALHDEVGQLLTGVRLEIAAAVQQFREAGRPTEFGVVDRLQAAVGLVDLSVATVQRIATAVRPPLLDQMGLSSAIRWEAAVFERRTGIRCRVFSSPPQIEAREHATVLYRILLEALANVARHADAGTVWIHIRERGGRLTMQVRDNGRGISDEAMANPHTLGLLGMRERALAVGGDVTLSRHRRGGTKVIVVLPLGLRPTTSRSNAPGA